MTARLHLILRVNPFKCINNLADSGLDTAPFTPYLVVKFSDPVNADDHLCAVIKVEA